MSYGDRSELIEDLVHCGRMINERNQEIDDLQVEICELKRALVIKPSSCEHRIEILYHKGAMSLGMVEATGVRCIHCGSTFGLKGES